MTLEWPSSWLARLRRTGVVAVVVVDDPEDAVPLTAALVDGGVDLLELTLRTPAALEALRRIRQAFPGVGLGAGTVLNPDQVNAVRDAGADFAVAPGLNPRVVEAAARVGLPFAPGVFTPSEIEQAAELGCRLLKFFPASADGTTHHFKAVTGPYAHLGLGYLPLGGLTHDRAADFLSLPSVVALGGSWIASRELIRKQDWNTIRSQARAIADRVRALRPLSKS